MGNTCPQRRKENPATGQPWLSHDTVTADTSLAFLVCLLAFANKEPLVSLISQKQPSNKVSKNKQVNIRERDREKYKEREKKRKENSFLFTSRCIQFQKSVSIKPRSFTVPTSHWSFYSNSGREYSKENSQLSQLEHCVQQQHTHG